MDMKKRDLITMFLCVPGAGLFALGMCMCLLPEWGAFGPGVVTQKLHKIALDASRRSGGFGL